jgi:hypothetical protein
MGVAVVVATFIVKDILKDRTQKAVEHYETVHRDFIASDREERIYREVRKLRIGSAFAAPWDWVFQLGEQSESDPKKLNEWMEASLKKVFASIDVLYAEVESLRAPLEYLLEPLPRDAHSRLTGHLSMSPPRRAKRPCTNCTTVLQMHLCLIGMT